MVWLAFDALSKMVTVSPTRPAETGMNCTVSVHFFCGSSCGGQFVAFVLGNPNTCGLATGTDASGFANVIGDPVLAEDELVSVNVSSLATSRLTLPKFFDDALRLSFAGTRVGVAVGVGVSVTVAVGVAVAVRWQSEFRPQSCWRSVLPSRSP